MNKLIQFLSGLFLLMMLSACAGMSAYTSRPIEAWVVDADTGVPIEGAIVSANWQLEEGSLGGSIDRDALEVKETVTDKNGRFYFEEFTKFNPTTYELRNQDPRILIFKPGYRYFQFMNIYPMQNPQPLGFDRTSQISGTKIKLNKFSGTRDEYEFHLSMLVTRLRFAYRGKGCAWKNVPRMLVELDKIGRTFPLTPVGNTIPRPEQIPRVDCGDPKEFFQVFKR